MRSVVIVAALAVIPVPAIGQSVVGTWKLAEVRISAGENAGTHTDLQPSLIIFTPRHYSMMYVGSFEPRPLLSERPSEEERGRIFTPFVANAGTYQLTDSTLTRTPAVAKSPNVMSGGSVTNRIQLRADSLWFITTAVDSTETRAKWVRVESLGGR